MLKLQIVFPSGEAVMFPAGGPVETDLIEAATREILARGVGLLRSEAHVEQDVRDGLRAAFEKFKATYRPAG